MTLLLATAAIVLAMVALGLLTDSVHAQIMLLLGLLGIVLALQAGRSAPAVCESYQPGHATYARSVDRPSAAAPPPARARLRPAVNRLGPR